MTDIYAPEEDSFLLSSALKKQIPEFLEKNPCMKFFEIGSGSGIQLKTALNAGVIKENILSCDINPDAVKHCKKLGFRCIKSDLFQNINGEFDIIVFNPPYLPEDEQEPETSKLATTGGKQGGEIINRFLKQAKSHLKKEGAIFLVASSLTKGIDFNGYKKRIVSKKKLFFEELYLYLLSIT